MFAWIVCSRFGQFSKMQEQCNTGWNEYEPVGKFTYQLDEPKTGWRALDTFTAEEKHLLRPIAETLAMLDGNAFFQPDLSWYEQYLPEADALFQSNGGMNGWAGTSHIARMHCHENEAIQEAYESWLLLKTLVHRNDHEH